jgi:uncharacterized protein (DUF433 family)
MSRTADAAYPAKRAAALAGVPERTLYKWAEVGIWVPRVPARGFMRWSYSDLYALRLIDWLRRDKPDLEIGPTRMKSIRSFLSGVEEIGEGLRHNRVVVRVRGSKGRVTLTFGDEEFNVGRLGWQSLASLGEIDLAAEFESSAGIKAPDLVTPRQTLRIIPGKLSSEPHVVDTRIPTTIVASLRRTGYEPSLIRRFYSALTDQNIAEAESLENQLDAAVGRAA